MNADVRFKPDTDFPQLKKGSDAVAAYFGIAAEDAEFDETEKENTVKENGYTFIELVVILDIHKDTLSQAMRLCGIAQKGIYTEKDMQLLLDYIKQKAIEPDEQNGFMDERLAEYIKEEKETGGQDCCGDHTPKNGDDKDSDRGDQREIRQAGDANQCTQENTEDCQSNSGGAH